MININRIIRIWNRSKKLRPPFLTRWRESLVFNVFGLMIVLIFGLETSQTFHLFSLINLFIFILKASYIFKYFRHYNTLSEINSEAFDRYKNEKENWNIKQRTNFISSLLYFDNDIYSLTKQKINLDLEILAELHKYVDSTNKEIINYTIEYFYQKLKNSSSEQILKLKPNETEIVQKNYGSIKHYISTENNRILIKNEKLNV